jgi:hypothetical protein
MLAPCGLATGGPNLTVTDLDFNRVKRARRWSIKNVAGGNVEGAFMTGTFEALMIA